MRQEPPNSRRAADFEHDASAVLTSSGFKLTHRLSVDRPPLISLQAERIEDDLRMRYAIDLKMIVDGRIAEQAIERFNLSTEADHEVFDGYWLIGRQVSTTARILFDNASERYDIFTLAELRKRLAKRPVRPRLRTSRTKIGKAVGTNHANILVTVAALIQLIDEKIVAEEVERPNSDEAIARRDATITGLRAIKEKLTELEREVIAFVGGKTKESAAVESVNSFADGVQAWWRKGHEQILHSAFGTSIFTLSMSICSLAGVGLHAQTVTLVAGALAGGKPLVDALKGLRKNLK